jgi:hypothetical protein
VLFQGNFFCRPRTITRRALPASRLVYLQLLSKLSRPDTVGRLRNQMFASRAVSPICTPASAFETGQPFLAASA